jgi:hypothetical protein
MQQPAKAYSLGVCQQNSLWVLNVSGLLLYSQVTSWQDLWSNTQDNKLQLVQPCIPVWQLFSFIKEEEIMLACL